MIRMLEGMSARRLSLAVAGLMIALVLITTGVFAVAAGLRAASDSSSRPTAQDDQSGSGGDGGETPAAPESPATDQPSPTMTTADAPPLPSDCADLFSAAMVSELQRYGVVLNPPWAVAELADVYPFNDALLIEFMSARPHLRCHWVAPLGGSGAGIDSRIVPVTPDEAASIQARLAGLGYSPIAELGSTRYVFRVDSESGSVYGESHIVVGGYWFATSWLELGVNGYTADMVNQLLN